MEFRTGAMLLPRMSANSRILLPPQLPPGAAGIVLVWDKVIPDMDLHMQTPFGCNVDWTNFECTNPSGPGKAHLDRDDMYGGGPETMTIDEPAPGNFKVFVHRYSSGDIYLSKAQLYVFQSDGRIFQFSLDNGTPPTPRALASAHVYTLRPCYSQAHSHFNLCVNILCLTQTMEPSRVTTWTSGMCATLMGSLATWWQQASPGMCLPCRVAMLKCLTSHMPPLTRLPWLSGCRYGPPLTIRLSPVGSCLPSLF